MSVKDLRNYIQKELLNKRFLLDTDEFLAELENLETKERDMSKRISAAQKQLEPLEQQIEAAKGRIVDADVQVKQKLANAETKADSYITKARSDMGAEREVHNIAIAQAQCELKDTNDEIEDRKSVLLALEKQVSDTQLKVDGLKAEQQKLLKKYS